MHGFHDFEYDYIKKEDYPRKWYSINIVKEWKKDFYDELGKGTIVFTKRPFKKYILETEILYSHRLNKQFDMIYNTFNN